MATLKFKNSSDITYSKRKSTLARKRKKSEEKETCYSGIVDYLTEPRVFSLGLMAFTK